MVNDILVALRKETKASFALCKEAAEKFPEDLAKAKEYLTEKIKAISGKREGRVTQNGIIEAYVHGSGRNIAGIVEVLCETDFVSKNEEFRAFAHEVALQVVVTNPTYVERSAIPEAEMEKMLAQWKEEVLAEGKPANIVDKVVQGKLEKYLKEFCLLDQNYFKDETKTMRDLLQEITGKIGENIKISRFERWQI